MGFDDFVESLRGHTSAAVRSVVVLSSVDSTNRLARSILKAGEPAGGFPDGPILVVAWEQTAGRGRRGRSWSSPAGRGVYASLALAVEAGRTLAGLPLLTGVGLCRCLDRHLGAGACRLKWPNDLLVEGRKLAGILIETAGKADGGRGVVVGWGINHGQGRDELPGSQATSLRLEAGDGPDFADVVWESAEAVAAELERLDELDYAAEAYEEHSIHRRGERLRFKQDDDEVEGVFRGFDARGRLRLEVEGEVRTLVAGETI